MQVYWVMHANKLIIDKVAFNNASLSNNTSGEMLFDLCGSERAEPHNIIVSVLTTVFVCSDLGSWNAVCSFM